MHSAELILAVRDFKLFCGGGSPVPHVASFGETAKDVLITALESSDDAGGLVWVRGFKDLAPYLSERGAVVTDDNDHCAPVAVAPVKQCDGVLMPLFLTLKLLDDLDASGWCVAFETGVPAQGTAGDASAVLLKLEPKL